MMKLNTVTHLLLLVMLFAGSGLILLACDFDPPEHDLDIQSSDIEIDWELQSNFEPDNQFSAVLTLKNNGGQTFEGSGWALYLNSIRALDPESFLPELQATHINGDFFKLEPTDQFGDIEPGGSKRIEYKGSFFAIKKSDAPQGFYFVFDDGSINIVESVTIQSFTEENQVNRSPGDNVEVPGAESIYQKNSHLTYLSRDEISMITPSPVSIQKHEGEFSLETAFYIQSDESFKDELWLMEDLLQRHNIRYEIGSENTPNVALTEDSDLAEEGYRLIITADRIELSASASAGMFYGLQSLQSVIENSGSEFSIPAVEVEDYPRFGYRGMHLDVSRNFQPIENVKRLLDVMAMYKLNKFHFHVTDDEGWRLAIDSFPELTEVGGRRGHTVDEKDFLIPSYGSGPDPSTGNSFGSGWYSRDDYIELLQFATDRHIEVIPEIDVPGHARAAIIAMKSRAERLKAEGKDAEAERYRLDEEGDESEYRSIQNFNDNVINVCQESTYRFLEVVFDEVIAMHEEADAPLTTIHIGGDEVPAGVWQGSPACADYMEAHNLEDTQELQVHFFGNLRDMLEERGLTMAGWEEVAFRGEPHGEEKTSNPEFAGSVIPHIWSNIWGSGTEHYAYELANMGYEIIMSHASNFYFDMAYNKHYLEPGFYWASMFDTQEPFSFIPFDLYKNAITDSYGNAIAEDAYDHFEQLTEQGRENILGLQGQLWTETVNEEGRMDYMIYPRLLGLAERAWAGNPEWGIINNRAEMWRERDLAWNEFANRLGRFEMNRLDLHHPGINYRIPPPGAIYENGTLSANTDYPGLDIRFTTDGSEPTADSQLYTEPVQIEGEVTVKLKTFNYEGRSSRATEIFTNIE